MLSVSCLVDLKELFFRPVSLTSSPPSIGASNICKEVFWVLEISLRRHPAPSLSMECIRKLAHALGFQTFGGVVDVSILIQHEAAASLGCALP